MKHHTGNRRNSAPVSFLLALFSEKGLTFPLVGNMISISRFCSGRDGPMDVKTILLNQRDGILLEGTLLKACIDMYRAIGDIQYRDGVLGYLDSCVSSDGILIEATSKHGLIFIVPLGKTMLFAWDETGEERYKKAAQQIMERLSSLKQSLNPDVAAGQGWILPFQSFVIEYDNRFGNKQRYKEA